MRDKYLPIGTVVLLKEATKRLMIVGYCSAKPEDPNNIFDYVGMLFPEGNLVGDEVALFNHEQIGTVVHMGLDDDEFKTLEKNIKEALLLDDSTEQPILTPVEQVAEDSMFSLPPFTPENINIILEQIKKQGDVLTPVSEPTPFNEEAIKKPIFKIPSLGASSSKNDEKKVDDSEKEEDKEVVSPKEDIEEKVADGKPVLQLQPIFSDNTSSEGESSSTNSGIANLSRL